MKKTVVTGAFLLALFAIFTAGIMDDNGRAGSVGSAGETKCDNCHNTYSINSGTGTIDLRTGITNNQYTPGQSYPMTFKVAFSGRSLFGMGLEALKSSNVNAGTLSGDGVHTTTKTSSINARTSVTHRLNGGASPDSMLFHFTWVAPAAGTGNVTMHYCRACCNASGSNSGDYIYNGSTVLTEAGTSGISSVPDAIGVEVAPNPVYDRCSISLNGTFSGTVQIRMFDMTGKLVRSEQYSKAAGENSIHWDDLSSLPRGTYLVSITGADSQCVKRIILQ
jgi:hypothetical protein